MKKQTAEHIRIVHYNLFV